MPPAARVVIDEVANYVMQRGNGDAQRMAESTVGWLKKWCVWWLERVKKLNFGM